MDVLKARFGKNPALHRVQKNTKKELTPKVERAFFSGPEEISETERMFILAKIRDRKLFQFVNVAVSPKLNDVSA
jgi:hypothetical protein